MKTSAVFSRAVLVTSIALPLIACADNSRNAKASDSEDIFFTMGVHNDLGCDAATNNCLPERKVGDPSDPQFPKWWISDWTMFRVMKNFENNQPPYTNPPSTLGGQDYTISYGTTYYDSTYMPKDGDGEGAMMEHYNDYCLPIFPIEDNNYSCSFVSLGNKAYFLTYEENRPKDMPQCCLFSPKNHPPRTDFIKHLPYSDWRSAQLSGSVQAYSTELAGPEGPILFGYAFNKQASPNGNTGEWYRHPQSFYFSGDTTKANAPIVSQNYTSFRKEQPEAGNTWDQVAKMCTAKPLPKCHL
ncbi:hypothetical protein ACFL2V_20685, partial [Pseudomonadota bacterium]